MCLVKILLGKTMWDKKLMMEKEYIILQYVITCLIKNLARKTQWDTTMTKGKRVQNVFVEQVVSIT